MPIIRRRAALRRGDLTADQRYHLLTGSTNGGGGIRGRGFETIEEFTEAWEAWGDELTEAWIERHPGTRPFGWWLLEHGHERPVVNPEIKCGRHEKHTRTFGFLHEEAGFGHPGGQEPQESYLRQHGLLSRDEIKAIESRPPRNEEDD